MGKIGSLLIFVGSVLLWGFKRIDPLLLPSISNVGIRVKTNMPTAYLGISIGTGVYENMSTTYLAGPVLISELRKIGPLLTLQVLCWYTYFEEYAYCLP